MIFNWLGRNNHNNLIGLDIGSESLKLLKINSKENPCRVEAYSTVSLPPETIVKGEIKNVAVVSHYLKEIVKETGIKTKEVALAIPRASTIIKNITIDSRLSPEDIESRAWIEANRHFPDLVGDIYLDFSVTGPSTQDPSQLDVILVACRKDQIKPYLEIIALAGLKANVVDVNSFALERALHCLAKNFPDTKTIALLNIDLNLSTLIVLNEKKLIYAHDQTFDGQRLMKQVKENKEDDITKLMDLFKENFTAHLRHTMHFFYSTRTNFVIEKMAISGDCSLLPNLMVFIKQEIGIDTVQANPFENMLIDKFVNAQELKDKASTLMLSCGLALSKPI